MSASMSEISISSLLALSMSVVVEAAMKMAPETPVLVNATVNPNYMEPVGILHFNPIVAAIVLALIVSFFTIGFAFGYLKMCILVTMENPEDQLVPRCSCSRTRCSTLISKLGLDPEMLEAMPQVQYKDLPADELEQKHFDELCTCLYSTQTKA